MKKELLLNVEVQPALKPQNSAAATITGPIYDLAKFESAILLAQIGAVTGAPTGLDIVVTVVTGNVVDDEDAPTSIADGAATTCVLTLADVQAGNASDFINIDAGGLKRWGQVSAVLTFTAGTAPATDISASWVFGDPEYSSEVIDAQNIDTYLSEGE